MENFIEVYEDVLSKDSCEEIINWFESNEDLYTNGHILVGYQDSGLENSIVDKTVKDSTDINCVFSSEFPPSEIIFPVLAECLFKYVDKFPFMKGISEFQVDRTYNIQRYYPNQGFFQEHCENSCKNDARIAAWSLYLNDVEDGGETLYTMYDLKVKAKAGRLCIFPAYWTHSHKGITSPTQTKYIATGWFSFT